MAEEVEQMKSAQSRYGKRDLNCISELATIIIDNNDN